MRAMIGFALVAYAAAPAPAGPGFRPPTAEDLVALGVRRINGHFLAYQPTFQPALGSYKGLHSGNYELTYDFPKPPGVEESAVVAGFAIADLPPIPPGEDVGYAMTTVPAFARAWAGDAALSKAYTRLPMRHGPGAPLEPTHAADEGAIVAHLGWPIAYTSKARDAYLLVYGSRAVELRWRARDLEPHTVRITEAEAIARHVRAVRDPFFRSEEERTGRDYFLGVAYEGRFPAPEANRHDEFAPAYTFPPEAPWKGMFVYHFAGKPVWMVRCWLRNYAGLGGGWVDAQTGAVIRFGRPRAAHAIAPFGPSITP